MPVIPALSGQGQEDEMLRSSAASVGYLRPHLKSDQLTNTSIHVWVCTCRRGHVKLEDNLHEFSSPRGLHTANSGDSLRDKSLYPLSHHASPQNICLPSQARWLTSVSSTHWRQSQGTVSGGHPGLNCKF